MKKKLLVTLGVMVALVATSVVGVAVASMNAPKHPSDYHIGISYDKAMKSDKPILALFYVDWCGYCVKFMPKYKMLNSVYGHKFNFVMVNAEDPTNKKLIDNVSISGLPTVYILDPKYDNKVLLSNGIYYDMMKFRVELERYLRIRTLLDKASKK